MEGPNRGKAPVVIRGSGAGGIDKHETLLKSGDGKSALCENNEELTIVRRNEREIVMIPGDTVHVYLSINHKKKAGRMDAYLMNSTADFPTEPMAYKGEELLFVLEGRTELFFDGKRYLLEKGDCCHYNSGLPHSTRSIGDQPSNVLLVYLAAKANSEVNG